MGVLQREVITFTSYSFQFLATVFPVIVTISAVNSTWVCFRGRWIIVYRLSFKQITGTPIGIRVNFSFLWRWTLSWRSVIAQISIRIITPIIVRTVCVTGIFLVF